MNGIINIKIPILILYSYVSLTNLTLKNRYAKIANKNMNEIIWLKTNIKFDSILMLNDNPIIEEIHEKNVLVKKNVIIDY